MEKLNNYLQQLLNTCGYELHLEPNKNPYIVTASGQVEAAANPLPGAQINSMIFTLIPTEVKQQLPNKPEVEFVHPHNLGAFNFSVRKSPSGFNVVISPAPGSTVPAEDEQPAQQAESPADPASSAEAEIPQVAGSQTEPETPQTPVSAVEPDTPPVPVSEAEEAAPASLEQPQAAAPEAYSPYAKGQYESEDDDLPQIEEDLSLDSADDYENDEFPGSQDSYQSTFESPAEEIGAESDDSAYEIDYSEFENEEYQADDIQVGFESTPVAAADTFVQETDPGHQQPSALTNEHHEPLPAEQVSVIEEPQPSAPVAQPEPAVVQPVTSPAVSEPVKQSPVNVAEPSFEPASPEKRAEMDALFRNMAEVGASDLHMSVSMPPLIRKDGKMKELVPGAQALDAGSMKSLLTSIMPEKNQIEFEEKSDTDFAYEISGLARFRANVFRDRKGMGGVFRIIPSDILTAEDLSLSEAVMKLCELSKGLVVVTGPTGSGKSTTLCAMVDWINKNREDHIITIEDPIEFTHENKKCLVNQREVHNHTRSFKNALRAALREDPDIVLVGEMRDLETVSIAIETAETGHLVFGTLHTTTAASTVDRIIDQFPADRQQQIRVMLSESLKGVIAQTLLPKIGGGRIAALETLIVTPAIANLIREGKTFQIPSQMQTGKNLGMVLLNDALMELVNKGLVEPKDAYIKAVDKDNFESLLKRNGKNI